jgi:hypothetical protein
MSWLVALRLVLESLAAYLKRRAEAYDEDLLERSLKDEREAQARYIREIERFKNPDPVQSAYLDSVERELYVYAAIRAASLRRFDRRAEGETD